MKKVKRINESQLRAIVAESVKKVLNEDILDGYGYADGLDEPDKGDYAPINPREELERACDYLGECEKSFKAHDYEDAYMRFKQGYLAVCRTLQHLDA